MPIAVQHPSANLDGSALYNRLCPEACRQPGKTRRIHTFQVQPEEILSPDVTLTDNLMPTDTRARADIERVLDLYVRLEYFGVRSASGSIVIDESRAPRKRAGGGADIVGMTDVEFRDALRTTLIREAVYAKPEEREDVTYESGPAKGERMTRVAPLRDVTQVIAGKARGGGSVKAATDRSPQLWKATVAAKLAKLPRSEQRAVLRVAALKVSLCEIRNRLQAARTCVERLRRGKAAAKILRRNAEVDRADLARQEEEQSQSLRSTVRTTTYRQGIERLYIVCTGDPETQAYIFWERPS